MLVCCIYADLGLLPRSGNATPRFATSLPGRERRRRFPRGLRKWPSSARLSRPLAWQGKMTTMGSRRSEEQTASVPRSQATTTTRRAPLPTILDRSESWPCDQLRAPDPPPLHLDMQTARQRCHQQRRRLPLLPPPLMPTHHNTTYRRRPTPSHPSPTVAQPKRSSFATPEASGHAFVSALSGSPSAASDALMPTTSLPSSRWEDWGPSCSS